jgi:hypothetical protein
MTDEQDTYVESDGLETAPDQEAALETDETVDLEATSEDLEAEQIDEEQEPSESEGEAEDDNQALDEELIEINVNGEIIKAPKEFAPLAEMQAYNTQTAQKNAEERRALEARQEQVNQQAQISQDELDAVSNLRSLDQRLEQYQQLDWRAAFEGDPVGLQQAQIDFQETQKARQEWGAHFQGLQQAKSQAAQAASAKRLEETEAYAQKNIKGWSPELAKETLDFAQSKGISPQQLTGAITPEILEILNLARIGQKAMSKTPASAKAKTVAQPTRTVRAKASPRASSDLASMSMEDYAKTRNRQSGM